MSFDGEIALPACIGAADRHIKLHLDPVGDRIGHLECVTIRDDFDLLRLHGAIRFNGVGKGDKGAGDG